MGTHEDEPQPVSVPIDGTLDLHTFHPSEVADLVPEYLDECLRRGIDHVRIIHGKGKGVLRRAHGVDISTIAVLLRAASMP